MFTKKVYACVEGVAQICIVYFVFQHGSKVVCMTHVFEAYQAMLFLSM